jgi:DNA-binding LytR/AlgR family response regulator
MTRVLIADDQALVRGGLRKIIETEPDLDVIGEASDGREAVDAVQRLSLTGFASTVLAWKRVIVVAPCLLRR